LRALVTADFELNPVDEFGQRELMIAGFRQRGIFPENVASLAEESLLWPGVSDLPPLPIRSDNNLTAYVLQAATNFGSAGKPAPMFSPSDYSVTEEGTEVDLREDLAVQLLAWGSANRVSLGFDNKADHKVHVQGFHPVFRVASSGQLLVELVVQFVQSDQSKKKELGGIPFRSGCTVVAALDGTVRYVISKPMLGGESVDIGDGARRLERQMSYLRQLDLAEPALLSRSGYDDRMNRRSSLANLHSV